MLYHELSDEQRAFVDMARTGCSILVDACIGSGKTTAIQVLCNSLPADRRILYLTYNKLLKLDAKERITSRNVRVTNYHGFAYGELCRMGVRTSVQESIATYVRQAPYSGPFDLLILDEYQDIDQEISDMLRHIKSCNLNMQIVAVGDMAQKIYDKTRLDAARFISRFLPGGYRKMEFTRCFRLGREHAALLGEIWGKSIIGVNEDFQVVESMEFNQVFDYLAGCNPGDILCLGSNTGDRSKLLNRLERAYPEKFNKNTIWSKVSNGEGGATDPRPGVGIFTTYDGCKGMERDICVVFDWDEGYWSVRIHKPEARYEILRNIFCVAASRGKRRIIFVRTQDPLSKDTLMDDSVRGGGFQDMAVSTMFDFKYAEDIAAAYQALDIREACPAGQAIDVPTSDALIDLSPCIGIYQEAAYFSGYDIDKDIKLYFDVNKDKDYLKLDGIQDWDMEQKVLYLTSLETNQNRYWSQVRLPFVTQEQQEAIFARLGTLVPRDAHVQVRCRLPFYRRGGEVFSASGFCDVLEPDRVIELKFVSELAYTHFLQCASYMIAHEKQKGLLWNVRTNQQYEITIPDRRYFLDCVARAVTKGRLGKYGGPVPGESEAKPEPASVVQKPAAQSRGLAGAKQAPSKRQKTSPSRDRAFAFCSAHGTETEKIARTVREREAGGARCGPMTIEGLYFSYGLKIPLQRQAFAKYFREYVAIAEAYLASAGTEEKG